MKRNLIIFAFILLIIINCFGQEKVIIKIKIPIFAKYAVNF